MWVIVDPLVNCKNVQVDLIPWMGLAMNPDGIVLDEVSVITNPDCARVSRAFMATDANIKQQYGNLHSTRVHCARCSVFHLFVFFFFSALLSLRRERFQYPQNQHKKVFDIYDASLLRIKCRQRNL